MLQFHLIDSPPLSNIEEKSWSSGQKSYPEIRPKKRCQSFKQAVPPLVTCFIWWKMVNKYIYFSHFGCVRQVTGLIESCYSNTNPFVRQHKLSRANVLRLSSLSSKWVFPVVVLITVSHSYAVPFSLSILKWSRDHQWAQNINGTALGNEGLCHSFPSMVGQQFDYRP